MNSSFPAKRGKISLQKHGKKGDVKKETEPKHTV